MWPSCKHPRTQSFRAPSAAAKTIVASIFLEDSAASSSSATESSARHADLASDDSPSTESDAAAAAADDMADAIVRGLRSNDRLLFEPRAPSSSILEKKPPPPVLPRRGRRNTPARVHVRQAAEEEEEEASPCTTFGGGVAVSLESADPYRDFRASMEEMVAAAAEHGAGDGWDWLERMLAWYLGANGKDTHPAIITAFVDLVVCMAAADDGNGGGASGSSRVSSFTLAGSELAASCGRR